jgi:hypothetical protein
MGHKRIDETMHYVHVAEAHAREPRARTGSEPHDHGPGPADQGDALRRCSENEEAASQAA